METRGRSISRCMLTGRKFYYVRRGNRPVLYISDDAKRCASHLRAFESYLKRLAADSPLTGDARRRVRSTLLELCNSGPLKLGDPGPGI